LHRWSYQQANIHWSILYISFEATEKFISSVLADDEIEKVNKYCGVFFAENLSLFKDLLGR